MRNQGVDAGSELVQNYCYQPYPTAGGSGDSVYFVSSTGVGRATTVVDAKGNNAVRVTRIDETALALYSARGAASLWRTARGNLVLGEVWTVMYTLKANMDTAVSHIFGYGSGSSNYGDPGTKVTSLIAGVPITERRTVTITPQMVEQGTMFNKWNIATTLGANNYIELSEIGVFKGDYRGPFVAGDHRNARWLGAVNDSQSIGSADSVKEIRNLHPAPDAPSVANGWGYQTPTGSVLSFETNTGPTGGPAMTVTVGAAPTDLRMFNTLNPRLLSSLQRYTAAFWFYSPRAMTAKIEVALGDAANANIVFYSTPTFAVVPGWQMVRQFFTVPADKMMLSKIQIVTVGAGAVIATGDVYRMSRAMIVVGEYTGDYFDGNTPGNRWLGAAGLSVSLGLPWRLEDILRSYKVEALATDVVAGTSLMLPKPGPLTVIAVQNARWGFGNVGYYEITSGSWNSTLGRRRIVATTGDGSRMDSYRSNASLLSQNFDMTSTALHMTQANYTDLLSAVWYEGRSTFVNNPSPSFRPMDATQVMVGVLNNTPHPTTPTITPHFIVLEGDYTLEHTLPIRKWLANKYGYALAA